MKILIVEDEKKSAATLQKGMQENGFEADVAEDGETGLRKALSGEYGLIILDIMLPGRDGWTICEELRRRGKRTPVLFLTARDAITDRVRGLEMGADDYLVKPYAFSELLARVRSLLRRSPTRPNDTIKIADLEIDLARQKVTRAGQRVDLTQKEFSLLSLLARRAGEALTRNLIAEEVWDMAFDSATNVVDVHVRRLRAKIDDPFEKRLIHTVRGIGYVLEKQH